MENLRVFIFNLLAPLFRPTQTTTQVFSCEICEDFKNTYFEEHLRTAASEFIGDTTLFHETILKKHTNGKKHFSRWQRA